MTHPIDVLKKIVTRIKAEEPFSHATLRVVGYIRKEATAKPGTDYAGNDIPGAGEDWRHGVAIDLGLSFEPLDLEVQQAVYKAIRALPEKEDLGSVEWGVSVDMGDRILLAADLAPGFKGPTARFVAEAMVSLYHRLGGTKVQPAWARFDTGNGIHVYLEETLPIAKKDEWFKGLVGIVGIDVKWAKFAQLGGNIADHGVLRWSPGRKGRRTPEINPFDSDLR
jgi:hypothetical protein